MIVFSCVILVSVRSYIKASTQEFTPCGPRLCAQLCDTLSYCLSPEYNVHTLTCSSGNTSRAPADKNTKLKRRILSRLRGNVTVDVEIKRATVKGKESSEKKEKYSCGPWQDIESKSGFEIQFF